MDAEQADNIILTAQACGVEETQLHDAQIPLYNST